MVVYNCIDCENDLRQYKDKIINVLEEMLIKVEQNMKQTSRSDGPFIYHLGEKRAYEFILQNIREEQL